MTILKGPRVFAYSQSGEKKREKFRIPRHSHVESLSEVPSAVVEPQTLKMQEKTKPRRLSDQLVPGVLTMMKYRVGELERKGHQVKRCKNGQDSKPPISHGAINQCKEMDDCSSTISQIFALPARHIILCSNLLFSAARQGAVDILQARHVEFPCIFKQRARWAGSTVSDGVDASPHKRNPQPAQRPAQSQKLKTYLPRRVGSTQVVKRVGSGTVRMSFLASRLLICQVLPSVSATTPHPGRRAP